MYTTNKENAPRGGSRNGGRRSAEEHGKEDGLFQPIPVSRRQEVMVMQKSAKVRRKQAKQARHEAKRKEALAQQLRREAKSLRAKADEEARIAKQDTKAMARSVFNHDVDPDTELATWFLSGQPRNEVRDAVKVMMEEGTVGAFVVRDKHDEPDCYALCVCTGHQKLVTFLVCRHTTKENSKRVNYFRVIGSLESERFETLGKLVSYYSTTDKTSVGYKLVAGDDTLVPFSPRSAARTKVLAAVPETPVATHVRSSLQSVNRPVSTESNFHEDQPTKFIPSNDGEYESFNVREGFAFDQQFDAYDGYSAVPAQPFDPAKEADVAAAAVVANTGAAKLGEEALYYEDAFSKSATGKDAQAGAAEDPYNDPETTRYEPEPASDEVVAVFSSGAEWGPTVEEVVAGLDTATPMYDNTPGPKKKEKTRWSSRSSKSKKKDSADNFTTPGGPVPATAANRALHSLRTLDLEPNYANETPIHGRNGWGFAKRNAQLLGKDAPGRNLAMVVPTSKVSPQVNDGELASVANLRIALNVRKVYSPAERQRLGPLHNLLANTTANARYSTPVKNQSTPVPLLPHRKQVALKPTPSNLDRAVHPMVKYASSNRFADKYNVLYQG